MLPCKTEARPARLAAYHNLPSTEHQHSAKYLTVMLNVEEKTTTMYIKRLRKKRIIG